MNVFDYPLDAPKLIRQKKKIRRSLIDGRDSFLEKRIAVLGGSTTNEIVDQLDLALLNHGIKCEFYQSEYAKYWEDAVFGNECLDNFHPDLIFIHTTWRNIQIMPEVSMDENEIHHLLEVECEKYRKMWDCISDKFACPIIQNNFDRPNYRLLGNKDVSDAHGRTNFIFELNSFIYNYAQTHSDFYVNDLDYISADYGLSAWEDPVYWHMYKYAMSLDAIPYFANNLAHIVKSIFGKNKKLLALDLDNTLWGGVIGDDGVDGIAVGPETPKGAAYSEFQDYCSKLKSIGIILAVNSKNNEVNALAGLGHPDSVLKKEDFVSIKANWENKDKNLNDIAKELSLGLDSFVFLDDNAAERAIVRAQLPMVEVPEVDIVEDFIKAIDHSGYFEVTAISKEDLNKTEQYHARQLAQETMCTFSNYGEYLQSLEMEATIYSFESLYVQRIAQLTNKSNQFNLTTLRCTEDDIKKMQIDDKYVCLCCRLKDKFADNGIITVIAGEIIGDTLHIRLWLMSCRVLKRGVEDLMMNVLVSIARKKGIKTIKGYYYPTSKNSMVKEFFKEYGFELESIKDSGNSTWVIDVNAYKNHDIFMTEIFNKTETRNF